MGYNPWRDRRDVLSQRDFVAGVVPPRRPEDSPRWRSLLEQQADLDDEPEEWEEEDMTAQQTQAAKEGGQLGATKAMSEEPRKTLVLDQRVTVFGIECTAALFHVGGAYLFHVGHDTSDQVTGDDIWLPVHEMNELCGAWLAFRKEVDKHE